MISPLLHSIGLALLLIFSLLIRNDATIISTEDMPRLQLSQLPINKRFTEKTRMQKGKLFDSERYFSRFGGSALKEINKRIFLESRHLQMTDTFTILNKINESPQLSHNPLFEIWHTGFPSSAPSKSLIPSTLPTKFPSQTPSLIPSFYPSLEPSSLPSNQPSSLPTLKPTLEPTFLPSSKPSSNPTSFPSIEPSVRPSLTPTLNPSVWPTSIPTLLPSLSPTSYPSSKPSSKPSFLPSRYPSLVPSTYPTTHPSIHPTVLPSSSPSTLPSFLPSEAPSFIPSSKPSMIPSKAPTDSPSNYPTRNPSVAPSSIPSISSSTNPTNVPSTSPSKIPTMIPSDAPSMDPTFFSSTVPSSFPTFSEHPTQSPSSSFFPSLTPTNKPSPIETTVISEVLYVTISNFPQQNITDEFVYFFEIQVHLAISKSFNTDYSYTHSEVLNVKVISHESIEIPDDRRLQKETSQENEKTNRNLRHLQHKNETNTIMFSTEIHVYSLAKYTFIVREVIFDALNGDLFEQSILSFEDSFRPITIESYKNTVFLQTTADSIEGNIIEKKPVKTITRKIPIGILIGIIAFVVAIFMGITWILREHMKQKHERKQREYYMLDT